LQRVEEKGPIVDDCNDKEDCAKNVVPHRLRRIFTRNDVIKRCQVPQELLEKVDDEEHLYVSLAIPIVNLDYVNQDDPRCKDLTDHLNRAHKQYTVAVMLQSVGHVYASQHPCKADQELQRQSKCLRIRNVVKDVAH